MFSAFESKSYANPEQGVALSTPTNSAVRSPKTKAMTWGFGVSEEQTRPGPPDGYEVEFLLGSLAIIQQTEAFEFESPHSRAHTHMRTHAHAHGHPSRNKHKSSLALSLSS